MRSRDLIVTSCYSTVDNFGRRLPGDGPMNLVLHRFKKQQAHLLRGIVVDTHRVDVRDFLVEPPLRGADVLYPPHQLLEIVEGQVRILQPLVVEEETLHDIFPQQSGGPDTEAGGHRAFYPVAHGKDGVQIVEIHPAPDGSRAFLPNSQGFLVSCLKLQFTLCVNVLEMQADVLLGRLEQLRHVLLRQPDRLALKPHVDLQLPVFRLVNAELSARRWCLGIFAHGFSSFPILPPCRGISPKERRTPIRRAYGKPINRGKPLPHGPLMVWADRNAERAFTNFCKSQSASRMAGGNPPLLVPPASAKLLFFLLRRSMLDLLCLVPA